MFAVHEEVELLKEQIKELMVKNVQLEFENNILRAAATPETLAILDASLVSPAACSHLLGQPTSSEIS
jgi:regulator of replication initiation timing